MNGVTTYYCYDGDLLISETTGDRIIVYLYDATGSPIGMQHRDGSYAYGEWDVYWYAKNLLGDIVSVYNDEGIEQLTYKYVVYGHTQIKTVNGGRNTPVEYNPFMYRGYYYDADLDLYYLQSRYYDHITGRFISPDKYVSTGQGLIGHNMYAYCANDPINYKDETGEFFIAVIASLFTVNEILEMANENVETQEAQADKDTKDSYTQDEAIKEINDILNSYQETNEPQSNVSFENGNVKIYNSYQVRGYDIMLISTIISKTEDFTDRTPRNLAAEWVAHNFYYNKIKKSESSRDADLNSNFSDNKWYTKIATKCYELTGWL